MYDTTVNTKPSEWSFEHKDGHVHSTELKKGDKILVVVKPSVGKIFEMIGTIESIRRIYYVTFLDFEAVCADESMMFTNNVFVKTY